MNAEKCERKLKYCGSSPIGGAGHVTEAPDDMASSPVTGSDR